MDEPVKVCSRTLTSVTINPVTHIDGDECYEGGPFKKNSNSVDYTTNNGISYYFSQVRVGGLSFSNYLAGLMNLIPKIVKTEIKDPGRFFIVSPNYECSHPTFFKYSKDLEGFKGENHEYNGQIGHKLDMLKLPKNVPMPSEINVYDAKIRLRTHPGVITRLLFRDEFKKPLIKITKDLIYSSVMLDVIDNGQSIMAGRLISRGSHYSYNSREKVSLSDVSDDIKNRPLLIPELGDIILNSTGGEHFKNYGDYDMLKESDLWLGHTDAHLGGYRRLKLVDSYRGSLEADGKSFDSRLPSFVIKKCFEILRLSGGKSKGCDNFFNFMMNGYITKFVHLPNGHVFCLKRGTPTGNVFTSVINSLATGVMWTQCIENCDFISKEIKQDYKLSVQGDDIVVGSNIQFNQNDLRKIREYMIQEFNYELEFKHEGSVLTNNDNAESNASFLRRVISKNMLTSRKGDIGEKLLSGPEYSRCIGYRKLYLDRRMLDIQISRGKSRDEVALYFTYMHFISGKETNARTFYILLINSIDNIWNLQNEPFQLFLYLFKIKEKEGTDVLKHYQKLLSINYENVLNTYSEEETWYDYGFKEKPTYSLQRLIQLEIGLKNMKQCNYFRSVYGKK